jgi:hypothetical protein
MSSNFITTEMLAEMSNIKTKQIEKLLRVGDSYMQSESEVVQDSAIKLNNLPRDILETIVQNYQKLQPSKYVLRDWVPKEKLDLCRLSGNPCAIEILMEQADYEYTLSQEKYDKLEKEKKISWMRLCINEEATNILKKYPSKILWCYLSNNSKQLAVDMIKERMEYEKINVPDIEEDNRVWYNSFCDNENPEIMELVKDRIEYEKKLEKEEFENLDISDILDWSYLSANPSAIDILKNNIDMIDWVSLSSNTNPEAIDLLRERVKEESKMSKKHYKDWRNKIDWEVLSQNPNAIDLLKENPHKIDWEYLSANTAAIDWLKENKNAIDWCMLSENPNAIELLKTNPKKIDWYMLCKNPNAIELLKNNPSKIYWKPLCLNENAFDLIKERFEYESSLTPEEYKNLHHSNKLDWKMLSDNKGLFVAV